MSYTENKKSWNIALQEPLGPPYHSDLVVDSQKRQSWRRGRLVID